MKYLKETTGFLRQHKIESIEEIESVLQAHVIIYKEGIDGEYWHEVNSLDNDTEIEYLKSLEEYKDFEICEE
jgi:hypothetical protein